MYYACVWRSTASLSMRLFSSITRARESAGRVSSPFMARMSGSRIAVLFTRAGPSAASTSLGLTSSELFHTVVTGRRAQLQHQPEQWDRDAARFTLRCAIQTLAEQVSQVSHPTTSGARS